ncbi:MAG: DUF2809 domain-containing protein [Bacteroidia bacterium]|nr:DUF2809 domain-containing protein [Bacteroidia bacterium]
MFQFQRKYLLLALVFFVVEVCIALFVHDSFVRPFVGDFLVVFLLYFLVRGGTRLPALYTAWLVLTVSFAIEIGQYFNLVGLLGLESYRWARIIIGTSFHWLDLVAYLAGVFVVYAVDRRVIMIREFRNSE